MNHALALLAAVFADPHGAAGQLAELRSQWRDLTPEERDALTPLAKLAAERVKAADDPDGYWSALESAGPPDDGAAPTDAARADHGPPDQPLPSPAQFEPAPPTTPARADHGPPDQPLPSPALFESAPTTTSRPS